MAVSGRLSNFSLPEVLQFAQEGNRTGLLTVRSLPDPTVPFQRHFIWLNQGRIIAASNRNDYYGLARLIIHHKWIAQAQLQQLIRQCPLQTPFGIYLKSQGLLTAEQLKVLFSAQIIREICALFALKDGSFHFTSNAQLPYLDMIGTSIPATEVTLPGLRSLKNWSALSDKLPNLTSALFSTTAEKPQVQMTRQEWKVWELADGTTSLTEIAQCLAVSNEEIQRIGFRLSVAGLVEELPLTDLISPLEEESGLSSNPPSGISSEFLSQMVNFLQKL